MSELVSTSPNPLDALVASVTAEIAREAKEEEQTPFFKDLMNQVEVVPIAARKYTAAHFFLRCPDKFEAVVHYLARGMGVKRIAALVRCHVHTVQAVRDRFPRSVATEKERLADLCLQASTLMVEQILDNPDAVPAQSWGLTAAQLADKALQLRGGPTVTIEHRHTFGHDDFNALVKAAPIDVEAQRMGLGAEKSLQMGDSGSEAAPARSGNEQPGADGRTDCESADLQRSDSTATTHAPSDAPDPGGEGVPENNGGAV